ncbi:hypothetical protein SFRURICE_012033 [Spodoptera frugiperda]|nr:hypothetical protein SFRURICE_012033 [Spodoptera frugiperda]
MAQRSDIHITRWLDEDREEDFVDAPAGSDDDVDHVEEQLESTSTEYSTEEEEDNTDIDDYWETVFDVIEGSSSQYYLALDGTKWFKKPLETPRVLFNSDSKITPGPKDFARTRKSQFECFDLFFDENTVYMIARFTNERIIKEQKKFARERDAKLTDEVEINALLGIFFLKKIPKVMKQKMSDLLSVPVPSTDDSMDVESESDLTEKPAKGAKKGSRGRCHVCRRAHMTKTTRDVCVTCSRFTCLEHSKYVCTNCFDKYSK